MKKKTGLIAAAVILALILLAEIFVILPRVSRNDQMQPAQTTAPTDAQMQVTESTARPEQPTAETTAPTEATAAETMQAATEPRETEYLPPVTQPPVAPPPVVTEPIRYSLPHRIFGTDLVIEALNSYDGIFLEDGSDAEVTGIAAIIVKNTGSSAVDFVRISMTGEQTDYCFEASGIGAGDSIVIMEAEKSVAIDQLYEDIHAEIALVDKLEMSQEQLGIEEDEDGKLKITNLTEEDIPCVRVFYKFYMEDRQIFVGGITYTVKLLDLKAGSSAVVTPSHYAAGGSRVIMAKIYGSDEA